MSTPMSGPTTTLTKEYILQAFSYLEEIHDLSKRNIFFEQYMVNDVVWEITGSAHALAGTRHSVEDHIAASFARLREKLKDAIRFVVRGIILEPETRSASIELKGYATKLNGQPYDNDYVWITHWNTEELVLNEN